MNSSDRKAVSPEGSHSSGLPSHGSPDSNNGSSSIGRDIQAGTIPSVSSSSTTLRAASTEKRRNTTRKKETQLNWRTATETKKHTVNSSTPHARTEDRGMLHQEKIEPAHSQQNEKRGSGDCASPASPPTCEAALATPLANSNGPAAHGQSQISTPSTGVMPVMKGGASRRYGEPPISMFGSPAIAGPSPNFGTKANPARYDADNKLIVGPPWTRTIGRKGVIEEKKRTERMEQDRERSKSTSSERGAVGFGDKIVPMALPRPLPTEVKLSWKGHESAVNGAENEEPMDSTVKKEEEEGCCVDSPSKWVSTRRDMVLPEHKELYIDSHFHLDFIREKYRHLKDMSILRDRYSESFPSTFKGGIANFIKPSNWNWDWVRRAVKDHQILGTSWGIHPHFSAEMTDELLYQFRRNVINNREAFKIVAIGECGVDLYRTEYAPLEKQLAVFKYQVELAYELDLPIVIHCREGKGPSKDPEDDVLNILKERPNHPIHRHCFTRDSIVAAKWMSTLHDCSFGLTPSIVIFPSDRLKVLMKTIPINRVLLETDSPYFQPKSYSIFRRSPCCLPGAAVTVAVRLAEVTGLSLDEVIRHTRGCTERIYRLPIQ